MEGQMCDVERRLIYNTVRELRPEVVVECGTWMGGGSTLAVARALQDNKLGKLHTFETDLGFYASALLGYVQEQAVLLPFITFHLDDFLTHRNMANADMAILDGPEDMYYTNACLDILGVGDVNTIILHDWKEGKCAEASHHLGLHGYILVTELDTLTGMALWQR